MKNKTSATLRKKIKAAKELRRRRKLERHTAGWSRSLELTGGASGLVGAVGVPLLRLPAEESGLRGHLSRALRVAGFVPGHDRGQVLVDEAIGLALGAVSVRGATQTPTQAEVACGPTASAVTAWRALEELDAAALVKVTRARAAHRRMIWQHLAARPPAGLFVGTGRRAPLGRVDRHRRRRLLVETHSEKEGAAPTYKKHIFGLHPILVTVANTGEIPAIPLRPGNAGSNTVDDHLTVLGEAIAQLPATYRNSAPASWSRVVMPAAARALMMAWPWRSWPSRSARPG